LILSQPKTVTTIGFLLDYFMTEVNNKLTQEYSNIITHQRDVVLFDMIARGLSLTHRPFNALELSSNDLDVSQTPLCWVMMDKQCNADTQQKLVNYVNHGGKLVLAGRMCVEDFSHTACTIFKDALGITQIQSDQPFVSKNIHVFNYHDTPVSFLETYTGKFDEVFATDETGNVAGFIKRIGNGKVMMFGAAMAANTLDDLDVVHQMALKMDCQPLFKLSNWVDIRISHGENGSFLFINNYQDDPVESTIEYEDVMMLGGHPVNLPARRGLLLPVEWRLNKDVIIHYVTSEVANITNDGSSIVLKIAQEEFTAELTLRGYHCNDATTITKSAEALHIRVQGKEGVIVLHKDS
jgi:beta-galactosidase